MLYSIKHTIVNEGPFAGKPAIELNFASCNLSCGADGATWVCSTKKERDAAKEGTHVDRAIQAIRGAIVENPENLVVVFTGGEPLLYQEEIDKIIVGVELRRSPSHGPLCYQIETNGTIAPRPAFQQYDLVNFLVDIKLSSSGVPKEKRLIAPIIKEYIISAEEESLNVFKFIVLTKQDMEEALSIIQDYKIPKSYVYFSIPATTPSLQQLRAEQVARLALTAGVAFSRRLSLDLGVLV